MGLDTFKLSNSNMFTLIAEAINGKMLLALGIVLEVLEGNEVVVEPLAKGSEAYLPVQCTYVGRRSAVLQVQSVPTVGDIVLVLSLQHYEDGMFNASKALYRPFLNGYSLLTCLAIPVGTPDDTSVFSVVADAETLTASAKKPVSVSVEGDHSESATGKRLVSASAIELNGNTKALVTGDLQSTLTSLATALNTEFTKIATAINALAPGAYVPSPVSVDITSTLTTTVKTDG